MGKSRSGNLQARSLPAVKKEIIKHRLIYLLLGLILFAAAFFRLYRLNDLLGFYYDQGRDALRVQDILNLRDFPAIGPVTGIEGIFLGPLWYYFLAPFYFLGKGNPIIASAAVGLFDVATVFLLYWFGKEFYDRKLGLIAAFFWGFSHFLIRSARWLSHPPLLPFFSISLLYGLGKIIFQKKERYLLLTALCLAIGLQLEAASTIFFLPALGLIWLVFKPKIKKRYFLFSFLIFLIFLTPQMLFEIKNNFLITKNFLRFNAGEVNTDTTTWAIPSIQFVKKRLGEYFKIFFSKLETNRESGALLVAPFWVLFCLVQIFRLKKQKRIKKEMTTVLLIFLVIPLFCLFFFAGNYGQLYDYHLIGFFPAFIYLFSLFTVWFLKKKIFWPILLLIFIWFLNGNLPFLYYYLSAGVDGPTHISLGNQLQAIDWIYQDVGKEEFNVDVYVPPVIPYAYNYLFQWYGEKEYGRQPLEENVSLLYTLYEVDPPHPERLENWLARQEGIGEVIKEQKFGGVTAQRRKRIKQ